MGRDCSCQPRYDDYDDDAYVTYHRVRHHPEHHRDEAPRRSAYYEYESDYDPRRLVGRPRERRPVPEDYYDRRPVSEEYYYEDDQEDGYLEQGDCDYVYERPYYDDDDAAYDDGRSGETVYLERAPVLRSLSVPRAAWISRDDGFRVPGMDDHYQPGAYSFGTDYVYARRDPPPAKAPPPPPVVEREAPLEYYKRLQPPPPREIYDDREIPRVRPWPLGKGRKKYLRPPRSKHTHKRPFVVRVANDATCRHCGANRRWGEDLPTRACDAADLRCRCAC